MLATAPESPNTRVQEAEVSFEVAMRPGPPIRDGDGPSDVTTSAPMSGRTRGRVL